MQLESLSDSIHLIFVSFNETVLSVLCWGSNGIEGNASNLHFPSSNTWWWGRWMFHLYLLPRFSLIPRDVFLRNSIFSREARMSCELSKSLIEKTRNVSEEERKKSCNRIHMSLCVPCLSLPCLFILLSCLVFRDNRCLTTNSHRVLRMGRRGAIKVSLLLNHRTYNLTF